MRIDDESLYREGIVVDRPVKKGGGSFVNAGMRKEIKVDRHIQTGMRVTIKIDSTGKCMLYNVFTLLCSLPYPINKDRFCITIASATFD